MTDAPHGGGDRRRIILLVGAVGAGKGTQAAILSRRLGLIHLASGELFRRARREGTELGEQASAYMARGELVPDEITIAMFMERLSEPNARNGAILDGFPRTVGQARALDGTLAEQKEQIERVVYIEAPTEELVRRVAGRRMCPTCGTPYHVAGDPPRVAGRCDRDGSELLQRDDDRPEVVSARLEKQVPPMLGVVDHYDRAGIVLRVDGTRGIDEVTGQILAGLADAA
jgi:adenylate kinase